MEPFDAFRINRTDAGIHGGVERMRVEQLSPGDVLIRARWSGINYKDALAASPRGRILRRFPINGGIDVAGEVVESADPRLRPGQDVLVTGQGLGESHDGGYARYVRAPADWVLPIPEGLCGREAMALGTAGFTAALALQQMELNGQRPDGGPVAVTGATGGVGGFAVAMLAALGFEVHAITGKPDAPGAREQLDAFGASRVVDRRELPPPGRPLEQVVYGGAVDSLGGDTLAWLLSVTGPFGNVAAIGLAADSSLNTTVMPFILRGVNLLGINSVLTPRAVRERVWQRLAGELKPACLERAVAREVGLGELGQALAAQLAGDRLGRTLVRID